LTCDLKIVVHFPASAVKCHPGQVVHTHTCLCYQETTILLPFSFGFGQCLAEGQWIRHQRCSMGQSSLFLSFGH